jgi:competence protein ComEC
VRLVVWCVFYVIGDALGVSGAVGWPVGLLAAAAGGLAIAARARGRRVDAAVPFGWLALGVVLGARALAPATLDPALGRALDGDDPVAIEAEVLRGPEDTGGGARLVVALAKIGDAHASGTLALSVARGWPDFGPGEWIACRARLRALRGTRNPGLPDPMLGLRAMGIDALAGVADPDAIRRVAGPTGLGPRRAAFLARRALRAAVDRAVPGEAGAFMKTAVLGDRRGVSDDVEAGFRAAGATHVLSVSGLHLAAVAAFFFLGVRSAAARVPGLALSVDPRAVAAAAALPAIGFFTLLTGEAVATERSALMLAIGMGALLVGRRASPGPAIAAAALVLLVARPLQLCDVSLQLSLASVAGIALLARPIGPRGGAARSRAGRLLRWLWRFGAATAAATVATGPLVAHCFGEVAPLAAPGNLALVPLVELVVVPVGLAGATLGALWPPLGRLPLAVAGAAARAALAVAGAFRLHAPLWVCRAPNWIETGALSAAGGLALVALGARGGRRRATAWAAAALAVVAAASLIGRDLHRRHARELVVTFLDVGQGDAAVVEAPGGAVMLVDGGGSRDGAYDTGARIVEPFLRARGIGRVDVVALSHPHPDHLNGLLRVLARFEVGAFWSSGDAGRNPQYRRLLALAAARGIPAPEVAARPLGAARVTPLGPFIDAGDGAGAGDSVGGERIGAPPGLTVNDASLVLRLAFAGRSVLFAGDLEADGEGELAGRADAGQDVSADVLKVPHHGSRTSSSPELVRAIHPRLAVISLGWRNQFHFPAPEVLARYRAAGTRLLRTDRDGAVTVTIAADGAVAARCERGCGDTQPAPAPGR